MPPADTHTEHPSRARFLEARDLLLRLRTDYSRAVAQFRWPVLEEFNWATDYFDAIAARGDRTALHIVEEDGSELQRSFAEMSTASNRVANFLRSIGVRRGDRLMVMLGNEVALWETVLAAMKLGVVVSPATGLLTPDDLRDRVDRGRITFVVAGAAHTPKFDAHPSLTRIGVGERGAIPPEWHRYSGADAMPASFTPEAPTHASDPMLLYFTSGTTARPKLVMHTHESYPVGHLSTLYWLGLRPGDVHWNISSPGWAKHAWSCFYTPWIAEATVFIYNYARFNAASVLDALVRHNVTSLCAPPTVWRLLIQEPLANYAVQLREVMSAGEPLNPEVITQVQRAWGLTIRDGYGQTETTAQIGNSPGQAVKAGSMGRPMVGYDIVLLGADGNPSDDGEICLPLSNRPLGLTTGYADDEGVSSSAMRNGYYHTGDVASRDADGYYTYVGRADDCFKASDYRLSPFELESALIEHPAISEAAVVPSPDPLRHAVPKAFVTLCAGYTAGPELAKDIFDFVRRTVAPYKRIRRLEFSELPKTISGKIRRVELRTLEERRRRENERAALEFFEEEFR
jgi:acetyl-CoA synthetase